MTEIWIDVEGYEGLYQISNLGNVKSLEREARIGKHGRTRKIEERILKPLDSGHGYLYVPLCNYGSRKNHYIHRLVAEHFVEKQAGYDCVNHKDYNVRNNRSDNLEWCTQKQNILYSAHRMKKPHKQWKQPQTKEKYIYIKSGRYRLCIPGKVDRTYPTIEKAIEAREVVLHGEKYFAG